MFDDRLPDGNTPVKKSECAMHRLTPVNVEKGRENH